MLDPSLRILKSDHLPCKSFSRQWFSVIFMSIEVAGGIKANSLSILTDAAHLLSDVAAFAISLFSLWAAGWEVTPRQSYGFFRIEILDALVSIQLIWLLAGILVYEAFERIIVGACEVNGFLMFIVAAFGLVVNIIMAVLLGHDHGHGFSASTHHDHQDLKHPKDWHHHTREDHPHHHHHQHHVEKHPKDEHHRTHEDHMPIVLMRRLLSHFLVDQKANLIRRGDGT